MLEYTTSEAQLTTFFERMRAEYDEAPEDPGLVLQEISGLRIFSLEWRGPADMTEAARDLGIDVPPIGDSLTLESLRLLAIGPARWRAIFPAEDYESAWPSLAQLSSEANDRGAALVEISSSLVVVKMSGPAVREVLASHCPADLDPRVLPPGHHLRSHLADHPALIRHGPSGDFEVHLDRSLAESCLSRLTRTAAAFGIAFLQTAPKAAYHQPIKEQEQ